MYIPLLERGDPSYLIWELIVVRFGFPYVCCSAWKLPIHPHTSITGLNMAASVHLLASIENGGYFEADVSKYNPLRDTLVNTLCEIAPDGCVRPLDKPGIGLEVDEEFLVKHPVIDGPGYV